MNPAAQFSVAELECYGTIVDTETVYGYDDVTVDGVNYRLNHNANEALILGYTPSAIQNSQDLGIAAESSYDLVQIPAYIEYENSDYDVVAILTNAFTPANQAGCYRYYDDKSQVEYYEFQYLDLPDSIRLIQRYAIGADMNSWEYAISDICIPQNYDLVMEENAIYGLSGLHTYHGPAYGSGYPYTIYESGGGQVLYDEKNNTVSLYTMNASCASFVLDIPGVHVAPSTFAYAHSLKELEITSFSSLGDSAIAFAQDLTTLKLPEATPGATIGAYAFAESWSLRAIPIPAGVTQIAYSAFRDSCACYWNNVTPHDPLYHKYAPGELKVVFAGETSPEIVDVVEEEFTPYPFMTYVYPDGCDESYVYNTGLTALNPHAYMTTNEDEDFLASLPPYEWTFAVDTTMEDAAVSGIIFNDTYDPEKHAICLPSTYNGYPVTRLYWNALSNVPENVPVYNTNLFNITIFNEEDRRKVVDPTGVLENYYVETIDGITYILYDGIAAVKSYTPDAIDDTSTITIPSTVVNPHDNEEYTVIVALKGSLYPVWASSDNGGNLESYFYTGLVFPDTIQYIADFTIGGDYWNYRLETVHIPGNSLKNLHYYFINNCKAIHTITGLPSYEDKDKVEYAEHRYFLYENNGATIIYDKKDNSVFAYTHGSPCTHFRLTIPDVRVGYSAFGSPYLKTLTIDSFRTLGTNAFTDCNSLTNLYLTASTLSDYVYIDTYIMQGNGLSRNMYINGTVSEIAHVAFDNGMGYEPGVIKVHFDTPTPPMVSACSDPNYMPHEQLTIVCPDEYVANYRNDDGTPAGSLSYLFPHEILTETEYSTVPTYEWHLRKSGSRNVAYVTGLTLFENFDPQVDVLFIPAQFNDYPIVNVEGGVFADIPDDVKIYNANPFDLHFDDGNDEARVLTPDDSVPGYYDAQNIDGIIYTLYDEYAIVKNYTDAAIVNGTLTVPATVTHDGQTYTVIAVLFNGLSPYFASGVHVEWNDEILERHYYTHLILPDTIDYLPTHAIGSDYWNDRLLTVKLPTNPNLLMATNTFSHNSSLTEITGLPSYDEKDNAAFSQYRYFLYDNAETKSGAVIYDRNENSIFSHTHGAPGTEFTVSIPDVKLESGVFDCSFQLSKITVDSYREIWWHAFSNCRNLRTLDLTVSEKAEHTYVSDLMIAGNWNVSEVYFHGTLDELDQGVFHEMGNYGSGDIMVHFDTAVPPVIGYINPDLTLPNHITIVCPDQYVNNYRNDDGTPVDGLLPLFPHAVITESEYNALPAYSWKYQIDKMTGEARINGIKIASKFDPSLHSVLIPSTLEGYPVTRIDRDTFAGLDDNIRIYNTNVYGLACDDYELYLRLKPVDGIAGGLLRTVGGIEYYLIDGKASVLGYNADALQTLEDGSKLLSVPATVQVDGVTYTVVSVPENGLSPFDAAGFHFDGFHKEYGFHIYSGDPKATELVRTYFYHHLELPDTIRVLSQYCIGESTWNYDLVSVKLPNNPNLLMSNDALHCITSLQSYTGLPSFEDKTKFDNYRYYIYENNGGQMLYDRLNNAVFDYTSGSPCKDFTVSINNVLLESNAFSCSTTLEKVTVDSFRSAGYNVFASCHNLSELTMYASEKADEVFLTHWFAIDTRSLKRVDIYGQVDMIYQNAFRDGCNCLDNGTAHDPANHRHPEGGMYVYFHHELPPKIVEIDEGYPPYNNVTVVCPDSAYDAYNNANLLWMNVNNVITASAFESIVPVEWQYAIENDQAVITGVTLNPTFIPAEDTLVIPSTLGGYPVTRINTGVLENLSTRVHIQNGNVYYMQFAYEDGIRIDFTAPDGAIEGTDGTWEYFINDGMASITGYTDRAIVATTNAFGNAVRTLTVPATITVNGIEYPVVSIYYQALAVMSNAGYISEEEYNFALQNGTLNTAKIDSYRYTHLVLPDTLQQIAPYAFSNVNKPMYNDTLKSISLPNNPNLILYHDTFLHTEGLAELTGLPTYGTATAADYKYCIYTNNDAMGIYGSTYHEFFGYTVGARTTTFVLDIDNIDVKEMAFYGARYLETLTVGTFRQIGNYAFAVCDNLHTLNLLAKEEASIHMEIAGHSPNLKEIHVPKEVAYVSRHAFSDWCLTPCISDTKFTHDEQNHMTTLGERKVYFESATPPTVIHLEDTYPPYGVTVYCPLGCEDAYAEAMASLDYYGDIKVHNADVLVSLSQEYGHPGETVVVDVYLTSSGAINSLSLGRLTYDASVLEFVKFIETDITKDAQLHTVNNQQEHIIIGFENARTFDGELLCSIEFRIKDDAYAKEPSGITFANAKFKMDATELNAVVEAGSVQGYILGDITLNGTVDIRDALYLIQHILLSYSMGYPGDLDFNGDGVITVHDATYLFNYSMEPTLYPIPANPAT